MFKNMGGNIPGGNFLGGSLMGGNIPGGSFPDTIFQFVNSSENNLTYLLLTRGRKNKWNLFGIVYWASTSHLSLSACPAVYTMQ